MKKKKLLKLLKKANKKNQNYQYDHSFRGYLIDVPSETETFSGGGLDREKERDCGWLLCDPSFWGSDREEKRSDEWLLCDPSFWGKR